MLKDFKAFLFRGNLVELAVALIMALAFVAVLNAFVSGIITPLIAAIFGEPSFASLTFTINGAVFLYGAFIDAVITFVLTAAAVYFFVVKPVVAMRERQARGQSVDPTTKQCPECLSEIPVAAKRCAFCASVVAAA
jgi:large conductance mechanosensitive channel